MQSKTQGSPWALQEPLGCPKVQMWTLIIMDMGVIANFYHMTTMDEYEVDETNTIIVEKILGPPLVHLPTHLFLE